MVRTVIYGGAFDPPHLGHLFAVTYALSRADCDSVWLLPTSDHVFGKQMAPFAERVAMVQAMIAPLGAAAEVCPIEAEREGPSRTYDTLALLSERHPERAFALMIGADNLTESHRWHRFGELVARWPVIALGRRGHEAALAARAGEPWCHVGPTLADCSSTELRRALRMGGDAELLRWLPDACREAALRLYAHEASAPIPGPVWVLGAGRAGRALASALRAQGVPVEVWSRSPSPHATAHGALPDALSDAAVWILCVSDPAIPALAARLARERPPRSPPRSPGALVALHCAGRFGREALDALAAVGAETGSLHPQQSLLGEGDTLRDTWFGVEGTPAARAMAERLVEILGGRSVVVPEGGKAAWHAAAVLSANFSTTLGAGGVALLVAIGLPEPSARAILTPLMRGTLDHFARVPGPDALTGPLARRDADAVAAHVAALRAHTPELLPVYRALALRTAAWVGFDAAALAALDAALTLPK